MYSDYSQWLVDAAGMESTYSVLEPVPRARNFRKSFAHAIVFFLYVILW